MKKALFLAFLILASISALAADSKTVSYKSGDETVRGLLYTPTGKRAISGADCDS